MNYGARKRDVLDTIFGGFVGVCYETEMDGGEDKDLRAFLEKKGGGGVKGRVLDEEGRILDSIVY